MTLHTDWRLCECVGCQRRRRNSQRTAAWMFVFFSIFFPVGAIVSWLDVFGSMNLEGSSLAPAIILTLMWMIPVVSGAVMAYGVQGRDDQRQAQEMRGRPDKD